MIKKTDRIFRGLSGSALDALKEFYADRDARLQKFEDLKAIAEADADASAAPKVLSMDAFAEDWNESQFWVCVTGLQTFSNLKEMGGAGKLG